MSGVVQLTFYQQKAEENREGWVDLHLALSPLPDSHKEESKQIIRRVTRHPRPVFHRPIVGWLVQLLGCFTLHVGTAMRERPLGGAGSIVAGLRRNAFI